MGNRLDNLVCLHCGPHSSHHTKDCSSSDARLIVKEKRIEELKDLIDNLLNQLHAARTLWCDSKRDPETGMVDVKYYDQFEKAIAKAKGKDHV